MEANSYKKRMNASVIVFSLSFKEAVRRMRSDLGIPADGFSTSQESNAWYRRHHGKNTRECYRPMPHYYWHFPKEFVDLVESFSYSNEPSRVNYYPDVPLDRCAMQLVHRFDLPEEVVDQVKGYILGSEGPLAIGPPLQLILIPVNEGEEGTKYVALVSGIDDDTTMNDWLGVWRDAQVVLRFLGISKITGRRPVDTLLLRDLGFWKHKKAGKSAREVLDDWIERHPEDQNMGEDTMRKAVQRIDKIMRPNSGAEPSSDDER